jgi:hypothetical protein
LSASSATILAEMLMAAGAKWILQNEHGWSVF